MRDSTASLESHKKDSVTALDVLDNTTHLNSPGLGPCEAFKPLAIRATGTPLGHRLALLCTAIRTARSKELRYDSGSLPMRQYG